MARFRPLFIDPGRQDINDDENHVLKIAKSQAVDNGRADRQIVESGGGS